MHVTKEYIGHLQIRWLKTRVSYSSRCLARHLGVIMMYRRVVEAVSDNTRDVFKRRLLPSTLPVVVVHRSTCRRSAAVVWKNVIPLRRCHRLRRVTAAVHICTGRLVVWAGDTMLPLRCTGRSMSTAADFQSQQLVGDQSLRTMTSLQVVALQFWISRHFDSRPGSNAFTYTMAVTMPYCCTLTITITVTVTLTFDVSTPKTMSILEYPKVIPSAKLEYFGIIRFWIILQIYVWKKWPCNLVLWPFNPKTMSLLGHPKFILYTKFEHFGIICFWVMPRTNKQTDKQTNRHPRTSYSRWPRIFSNYSWY